MAHRVASSLSLLTPGPQSAVRARALHPQYRPLPQTPARRSGALRPQAQHARGIRTASHATGRGTGRAYRVAARSRPRSGGLCRLMRALPPLVLGGATLRHRRPRLRTLQRSLPPSAPRGRGLRSVLWQVSRRSSRGVSAGFVVAHLLRVGACTAHRSGAAPSAALPALAPVALRQPAP